MTNLPPCVCRENSKQLNEHRIGVLRSREEAIQGVVQEAKAKLVQITQDKEKYTQLLSALIVQVPIPSATCQHGQVQCQQAESPSLTL